MLVEEKEKGKKTDSRRLGSKIATTPHLSITLPPPEIRRSKIGHAPDLTDINALNNLRLLNVLRFHRREKALWILFDSAQGSQYAKWGGILRDHLFAKEEGEGVEFFLPSMARG